MKYITRITTIDIILTGHDIWYNKTLVADFLPEVDICRPSLDHHCTQHREYDAPQGDKHVTT